jgi:hypothetical protein
MIADRVGRRARGSSRNDRAPYYLVSSAGVPNYGDELITRSWLDWLARRHPRVPVWLDCIEPGRAFHLFRDAHPRLRTTNTLWHLALSGAGMPLDEGEQHVTRMVRDLGTPRFDAGLRDLRGVRSVHLLGGGYLNTVWPHQLLLLPALRQLRLSFGVRLFATGQGMSPLDEEARVRVAEWVKAFELYETRDAHSAGILDAQSGLDDAFLAFANKRPLYSARNTPDVMLILQGDFRGSHDEGELADAAAGFIARRGSGRTVGVVESLPPDDSWLVPRLRERGVEVEVYPFLRIWDEGMPARAGQEWLSTRFHFHLMAAAAGARGVVLNLNPDYYGVKHASLRRLGTGWHEVDSIDDIADATPGDSGSFGTASHRAELGRVKALIARRIYG